VSLKASVAQNERRAAAIFLASRRSEVTEHNVSKAPLLESTAVPKLSAAGRPNPKSTAHPLVVRHHLDRRAAKLFELLSEDSVDDLLNTRQLAEWLGVSIEWCEIGRSKGWGPPFVRVGPRRIRYRRADVVAWLKARTHASTSEYAKSA
jgi:predicted DNA-binding transcriptional regulator AlpA